MEIDSRKPGKQNVTREGFDLLLAQLDADRNRAGEKYEILRRKLIKFFGWWGSAAPEDLADETFDRVAKKFSEGEAIRDLNGYLVGVARLIFKEYIKGQIRTRSTVDQLPRNPSTSDDPVDGDAKHECYESCLSKLPVESRNLVLRYYQMQDRNKVDEREALCEEMQIPINLLRVRAFRIRKKLGECLQGCLKNRVAEL
jgi:DNA-directed RNA polymerase specialized sigma24 family protein